jgi:hypothetical protein
VAAALDRAGSVETDRDRTTAPQGPTFRERIGSRRPRRSRFYDFDQINQAAADAASGTAIKPILRIGE